MLIDIIDAILFLFFLKCVAVKRTENYDYACQNIFSNYAFLGGT